MKLKTSQYGVEVKKKTELYLSPPHALLTRCLVQNRNKFVFAFIIILMLSFLLLQATVGNDTVTVTTTTTMIIIIIINCTLLRLTEGKVCVCV